MNPALAILVFLGLVAIWFLASSLYRPLGRFIGTIASDAIDTMKSTDNNEERKKEGN
jgi:hypothetical protein